MEEYLSEKYEFKRSYSFKNSLLGYINDIKVDFITLKYPNVEDPVITNDGIRISSIKDIAAMKLSAIADAGTRLKDFVDIAYLSTRLSFSEMLDAYQKKYNNPERLRPVRGLTFFDDIEFEESVTMVHAKYKWEKIEKRLNDMVRRNNKVFSHPPLDKA
jgi:hypothetical protein